MNSDKSMTKGWHPWLIKKPQNAWGLIVHRLLRFDVIGDQLVMSGIRYNNIAVYIPLKSLTSLMMEGEASVVSSSKGKTVAILSNNLLSASFSIVVELPPVALLSTTSKSTTTLVTCSMVVYMQYRALWSGEWFQPSPHRHTRSQSVKAFFEKLIHLAPHLHHDRYSTLFLNRMKVFLLITLGPKALHNKPNFS